MALKDVADDDLISRIGKKDYEAFNEFWHRYDKRALLSFQRLLKDKTLIEDSYQQFFMVIWNKSPNYRGGDVKAYCYGIMRNIYKEAVRKNMHKFPLSFFEEEKQEKIMDEFITSQHEGNLAYNNLLHEEVIGRIKEFEAGISGIGKRIFALRMESGLKWGDISRKLEISRRTCYVTYSRLCTKLKDALKEYAFS